MTGDIPPIDWAAPWLAPYREAGQRVMARWSAGSTVADALNAEQARGVPRFVPQSALPAGEAYERFIRRHAEVPTRDGLHDFFNGLVWLGQPALKTRMNELQAQAIDEAGIGPVRGALRDGLTLFDENGALLQAPQPLLQALRERDWPSLFGPYRPLWAEARLVLVGHALLEKLVQPRKPITAHVLPATLPWDAGTFAGKRFMPLPVLGVPGWWPANEAPAFYDDPSVFRPAGSLRSTGSARRCRS